MIKCAKCPEEISFLSETGVEAQKIRSLLMAYGTKYDFCRFYTAKNLVIAQLIADFVVCELGEIDVEELAEFLGFSCFSDIFCSEKIGPELEKELKVRREDVNLMRFAGVPEESDIEIISPYEAYKIIKTGFNFEPEPWYLDMSHRVRHGVSQLYGLDGAALAIQYNYNGEALISQVATLPENRGKGCAKRLISAVCAQLSESEIFVLCEDELLGFYEKIGFVPVGKKCCLRK